MTVRSGREPADHGVGDGVDRAVGVDGHEEPPRVEVPQQRHGHSPEGVESFLDEGGDVISPSPFGEPLPHDRVGHHEHHRRVDAAWSDPAQERVELLDVPRKAVEQEAVGPGVGSLQARSAPQR